jgi:hypothetical protein
MTLRRTLKDGRMKLQALADAINAYLKRFAADPTLSKEPGRSHSRFWNAQAYYPGGAKIRVIYVSYQGNSTLSKDQAERYLKRLQEGFVGRHFEALRDG